MRQTVASLEAIVVAQTCEPVTLEPSVSYTPTPASTPADTSMRRHTMNEYEEQLAAYMSATQIEFQPKRRMTAVEVQYACVHASLSDTACTISDIRIPQNTIIFCLILACENAVLF